jgi:hypothetical protein
LLQRGYSKTAKTKKLRISSELLEHLGRFELPTSSLPRAEETSSSWGIAEPLAAVAPFPSPEVGYYLFSNAKTYPRLHPYYKIGIVRDTISFPGHLFNNFYTTLNPVANKTETTG